MRPSILTTRIAAATLAFVSGDAEAAVNERVLMTVLFTDIVGSTEQVVAGGDSRWCHQLDAHDELVDTLLARYGGTRAKHTGDGIFAHFDGPTKAARCALDLVPALATRGIRIRAGCTSENASDAATSGAAWRYTSEPG